VPGKRREIPFLDVMPHLRGVDIPRVIERRRDRRKDSLQIEAHATHRYSKNGSDRIRGIRERAYNAITLPPVAARASPEPLCADHHPAWTEATRSAAPIPDRRRR